MNIFLALPMLMLIAGFLALIIFAIVRKKWALLFIPLGLIVLLPVIAIVGVEFEDSSAQVGHVSYVESHTESVKPDHAVQPMEYKVGTDVKVSRSGDFGNNGSVKATSSRPNVVHTSVTPNFAFMILLICLIGLVVLVVIAIIRKKWALLFIPLGVAALGVLSIFYLRVGHISPRQEQKAVAVPPRMLGDVPDEPLPAVWSPGIEKDYQADTYYSKIAALRSIANRLDKIVAQMVLNGKPIPAELALITYKGKCPKELLAEAYNIIQETLPDTNCIIVPTVTAEMDSEWLVGGKWYKKENWISFDFTEFPNPSGNYHITGQPFNDDDLLRGSIRASIHLDGRSVPVSTSIVSKPWLGNFSAFQNSTPQRQFTVAYSQTTCRSLDQAVRQASSQAQKIVGQLITDIHRSMPRSRRGMGNYTLSREDLYKSGIIVDNFHQSFNGTVSPIYRQALLLDISPDKIQPLAQQKINSYNAVRQDWAYHIMSAIGIALVICAIYLILNAATKGYYTVVLRILTVIGIIAVVLLLTMV